MIKKPYIYIDHIPNVSTHWGYISTNNRYFRIYISNMLKENIKDGFLKTPLLLKTQELYYNKM